MLAYNPQTQDRSGEIMAMGQVGAAETQANMYNRLGSDIGGALASIGNMYGKARDKKKMLAGMDKAVGAMSDMGAVTADFRDRYMAVDQEIRPFLFEAIASPMFKSYTAGQSAAAQAQAWDKYKKTWGSDAGGEPQGWTVY